MTFFALPKVEPRSPASLGSAPERASGGSPARSTLVSETPAALREPIRSHSRREGRPATDIACSAMESTNPPALHGRLNDRARFSCTLEQFSESVVRDE